MAIKSFKELAAAASAMPVKTFHFTVKNCILIVACCLQPYLYLNYLACSVYFIA